MPFYAVAIKLFYTDRILANFVVISEQIIKGWFLGSILNNSTSNSMQQLTAHKRNIRFVDC